MKEWLTLAEIEEMQLPALPGSLSKLTEMSIREGWRAETSRCRVRFGKGGGYEYHYSLLPAEAQARIVASSMPEIPATRSAKSESVWAAYSRLSDKAKAEAQRRLTAVDHVEKLVMGGQTRQVACAFVAGQMDVSIRTLWTWLGIAGDVARADRLAALAPRHAGRTATAECDPRAWDAIKADYLRLGEPAWETCYWRLTRTAEAEGWSPIPSSRTLLRRIEAEFPLAVRTMMRVGKEATARIYPHQRRDRSVFRGLEAVNADGHKFDVFVRWPDGSIGRPLMIGFQDLYSGTILSHRIDQSENKEMVRLAFADVVSTWGIPDHAWLDNGRAFASKWLTGRMPNRYRFKIKDEEPEGILLSLGLTVHWTTPYHGQSKPIERAWKTLCEEVSKHPAFAGAYTGNSPLAKPEDYGSKAVPIDTFRAVVASEIAAHNARSGRKSATAKGRSFLETLQESLALPDTMVRRATAEQRRMLLMAAESILVQRPTGEIQLMGSRYWAEELPDLMGDRVIVRFDPQQLAEPISVYTLDNRFICEAEAVGDVAFNSVDEAREHARRRKAYLKAVKAEAEAGQRLSIDDYAALIPREEAPVPESPRVVKIAASGHGRRPNPDAWEGEDAFSRAVRSMEDGDVIPFRRP